MRRLIFTLLMFLVSSQLLPGASGIQRMEPPFWYTGMKNHELQIMFYGEDIAASSVSLADYEGVRIKEVCEVENPNYLFVYLDIDGSAKPGILDFTFSEGRKSENVPFELRPRNTKPGAMGFSSADVLYLIMPDRFANGNPDNDVLDGWEVDRTRDGRHGGDIQGIVDHLDYIDELGVTAIWLNPVQYNRGGASHGYAISDFYLVDPRLGSNEEYCAMIEKAHEKGIKVVMDMIFNHCGSSHWWMSDIPSSDWFNHNDFAVRTGSGERVDWNEVPATTHYKWVLMDPHAPQSEKDVLVQGWFSGGMPDLNQKNRHLATYLIQNSLWWIEYARIDGIRMDTYPYADYDFMARWCDELFAEYPDFNIVGEGWYPRNSAAGWWQGGSKVNAEGETGLKTVMDFDLTFTVQDQILKESNTSERSEAGLFKIYECITQDFLIPDSDNVLTFLDNHDIARFMKEGDPLWKFKQGVAFILTTRGIPQIYYGTEIMMGRDPGNWLRADFPGGWKEDGTDAFTSAGRTADQNEAWNYISTLLNWRRTSDAVKHGRLVHYTPDNATRCYVYARTDGEDTVLVMLNGSDRTRTVDMERFSEVIGDNVRGTDVVTGEQVDVTAPVSIPARGVYVLELDE